ncbi:MAG: NAD(P)-dependent oxidoreductase [Oscillospiraceae bacterium]|nr:NAD(P)-dependent oxidoreductase [Oscillospiraceae bacterium]
MEIFITGGTGNIGQYVTLELLSRGHSIRLLTRTPERIPAFSQMENVKVIKGSILDFDVLKEAVMGCDAAIHIALGWGNDPVEMLANDTRVTAFLLDACESAGIKNFIYTSSTAATGNLRNGMDETALRIPTDLYGSTKAASELYLMGFKQYYSKQGGYGEKVKMRRNVIRPGYTYSNPAVEGGASQSDDRFIKIARAIVNDNDLSFNVNDGTQFLSSRQIAKVYADLCESDLNEEIFFALGKNSVSWYEIALAAKEMYPQSKSVITAEGEKGEPWLYCVDKIERMFGLSFDSWEDLRNHIKWNLDRALAEKEGKAVHNTKHEFC